MDPLCVPWPRFPLLFRSFVFLRAKVVFDNHRIDLNILLLYIDLFIFKEREWGGGCVLVLN